MVKCFKCKIGEREKARFHAFFVRRTLSYINNILFYFILFFFLTTELHLYLKIKDYSTQNETHFDDRMIFLSICDDNV